jgi:hypothetical protein
MILWLSWNCKYDNLTNDFNVKLESLFIKKSKILQIKKLN